MSLPRDLLVYGIGEISVKAFGLITLPIYTRVFSPEEFGVMGIVLTLSALLMTLLSLGSDAAYVRFFFEARTLDERQLITSTWIGFLACWGVGATLLFLPLSHDLGRLATGQVGTGGLVAIGLLIAPIRLINLMLGQVLRNEFRATSYTVLNIAGLALSIAYIMIAIFVLEFGIAGVLIGMILGEVTILPFRAWSTRDMFAWRFSSKLLLRLLAFGLPIVPASLAYWVFTASDRVLLGNLASLEEVGLYGVAASLVSLTTIAITALGQAWGPHAVLAYEVSRTEAGRLFGRMMTYVLAAFGLLAVGITNFSYELVDAVAGDKFRGAADAVAPLALGVVAYATTQITSGGITLTRRTGFLALYAGIAAVVNVGLNVLLIPPFGLIGAAWATAFTYLTLTLGYLITSQRLWPIEYERRRGLVIVALTVVFVAGTSIFDPQPVALTAQFFGLVAWKVLYCGAYVAGLFLLRGLDSREVGLARGLLGIGSSRGS